MNLLLEEVLVLQKEKFRTQLDANTDCPRVGIIRT